MNILCVCDEGNNRSVHIAHLLKYRGHDTLAVGVNTSSDATREMLAAWADLAILTDPAQRDKLPAVDVMVWPIPDVFRRPFNVEQNAIVRRHITESGL